jgi:hypothetical protein
MAEDKEKAIGKNQEPSLPGARRDDELSETDAEKVSAGIPPGPGPVPMPYPISSK